jgi:hypothetical protein
MQKVLACLILSLATASVAAGEVYKWTDEQGRTHFGDTVPPPKKDQARQVDLKGATVSPAQFHEAKQRAENDKRRMVELENERNRPKPTEPAAKAEKKGPDSCAEQWSNYNASHDCFGPYRLANGTVRAEAFQNCKTVAYPSCRMPDDLTKRYP